MKWERIWSLEHERKKMWELWFKITCHQTQHRDEDMMRKLIVSINETRLEYTAVVKSPHKMKTIKRFESNWWRRATRAPCFYQFLSVSSSFSGIPHNQEDHFLHHPGRCNQVSSFLLFPLVLANLILTFFMLFLLSLLPLIIVAVFLDSFNSYNIFHFVWRLHHHYIFQSKLNYQHS